MQDSQRALSVVMEEGSDEVDYVAETQLDETQVVPEAQFEDYDVVPGTADFNPHEDSITPRTARILAFNQPTDKSSYEPDLADKDLSLPFARPTSAGKKPDGGFAFSKPPSVTLYNFSGGKQTKPQLFANAVTTTQLSLHLCDNSTAYTQNYASPSNVVDAASQFQRGDDMPPPPLPPKVKGKKGRRHSDSSQQEHGLKRKHEQRPRAVYVGDDPTASITAVAQNAVAANDSHMGERSQDDARADCTAEEIVISARSHHEEGGASAQSSGEALQPYHLILGSDAPAVSDIVEPSAANIPSEMPDLQSQFIYAANLQLGERSVEPVPADIIRATRQLRTSPGESQQSAIPVQNMEISRQNGQCSKKKKKKRRKDATQRQAPRPTASPMQHDISPQIAMQQTIVSVTGKPHSYQPQDDSEADILNIPFEELARDSNADVLNIPFDEATPDTALGVFVPTERNPGFAVGLSPERRVEVAEPTIQGHRKPNFVTMSSPVADTQVTHSSIQFEYTPPDHRERNSEGSDRNLAQQEHISRLFPPSAQMIRPISTLQNPRLVEDGIHNASGQRTGRVTKSKPKQQHVLSQAPIHDLTTNSLIGLLAYTIQKDAEKATNQHKNKQLALERNIIELHMSETKLRGDLEFVQTENNQLVLKSKNDEANKKAFDAKISGLQKYVDGISNDLQKEKANAKALEQQLAALSEEGKVVQAERKGLAEEVVKAAETLSEIKSKLLKECGTAYGCIQTLEQQKAALEKEIDDKSQRLIDEIANRSRLEEQLTSRIADDQSMEEKIKDNHRVLIEKLAQIEVAVEPSVDIYAKNQMNSLAKLIQDLHSREFAAPQDVKRLESLIDGLKGSLFDRIADLKDATSCSPQITAAVGAAYDLEKKLRVQLSLLKGDLISAQDLQIQLAELREAKAVADERVTAKDQQLSDLQTQLSSLREIETKLTQKFEDMELHLSERAALSEREVNTSKQELEEAQDRLQSADKTEATLTAELEQLKTTLKSREDEIGLLTSQKLESEKKTTEQLHQLRTQLSTDANRLRQEKTAEYENKLHQEGQKHRRELEAALEKLELAKADGATSSRDDHKSCGAPVEALKSEHASAIEAVRKQAKDDLDDQARWLTKPNTKLDAIRKELNEKFNREKADLHRQLTEAETAKDEAMQSLEDVKRASDQSIEKQSQERAKLKKESQAEIDRLNDAHRKEQDRSRQRAIKAEEELNALRKCSQARHEKSQVSFTKSQSEHTSQEAASTPFKVPKRKVVNRSHALNTTTDRPGSAIIDDIGNVENVSPNRVRTFAQVNALMSDAIPFAVHRDNTSSSNLIDMPSISCLYVDPRVLRERTMEALSRHGSERSIRSGRSQPLENPFATSMGHPRSNTASRLTPLPASRRNNMTPNMSSIPARDSGSSHRTPLISHTEVRDSQTMSGMGRGSSSDPPSHIRLSTSHHFVTPPAKSAARLPFEQTTRSSSPSFIEETQTIPKVTTYNHRPGSVEHRGVAQSNSSAIKRRRSSTSATQAESNKRSRYDDPTSQMEEQSQLPEISAQTQANSASSYGQSQELRSVIADSQAQSQAQRQSQSKTLSKTLSRVAPARIASGKHWLRSAGPWPEAAPPAPVTRKCIAPLTRRGSTKKGTSGNKYAAIDDTISRTLRNK